MYQTGHQHVEFNAMVFNYPERADLEKENPLDLDIDRMLGHGNVGLNLLLAGHGSSRTILLKFSDLPYVQVYQKRANDAPFIDPSLEFHKNLTQSTLQRRLSEAFCEVKGDASATAQVILGFYKHLSRNTRSIRVPASPAEPFDSLMATRLNAELNDVNIWSVTLGRRHRQFFMVLLRAATLISE